MTFSDEWNERYIANTNLSIWPWSDVVSLIMRHTPKDKVGLKVLEIGCGAGANIPFLLSVGMEYYAMEGSPYMVEILRNKYPELKDNIVAGDFTKNIPFDVEFDYILDRSSMTHNSSSDITRSLQLIIKKLKFGGKYFGIDWFSLNHSDLEFGENIADRYTFTNFQDGQFKSVGNVHFSDKAHLEELFLEHFRFELLEEKKILQEVPNAGKLTAFWNFIAIRVK